MYMTDRLYNKGKDRNHTLTTTEGIPKGDWLYNKVLGTKGLGGAKVMYDKKGTRQLQHFNLGEGPGVGQRRPD